MSPNALCAIGKDRYATTDARKYADYVVTDAPALPVAATGNRDFLLYSFYNIYFMHPLDGVGPPPPLALAHPLAQPVHTTYDSFGAVVADYTFYPRPQVLYVRWHGHVTGDELVRAAHTGLQLNQQWQPRGLFQDLRGSSGEWGEAGTWLEYEWIPGIKAKCPNLRGIAALLDAETPLPYSNTQVLAQLDQQFDFQVFYSLLSAWRWMNQRTQPHAEIRARP